MEATPSRPRRSTRLASATPSNTETAHAPTRVQAGTSAAVFDPSTFIIKTSRGDRAGIPGLTKSELQALVTAYADRDAESMDKITSLETDLRSVTEVRDQYVRSSSTHRMKMAEIMRKHNEKKAAERTEAGTQTADILPPAQAQAPAESAPSPQPVTPPETIIPSPAAPASTSFLGSAFKYITSSFSKKRRAEAEPAWDEPVQKRLKPSMSAPSAPRATFFERQERQEPAPTAIEQPTTTSTSTVTELTPTRPASATIEPPATAPPRASFFDQPSTTTTTTTSAKTPKRKRTTATLAAATPLAAIAEASPLEMHTITPRPRRTVAEARLAQNARKAPQSAQPQRYAWEAKPLPPKEPNADARIAKIRRAEALRRELLQLEDEEPMCKRTKRVKADDLPEIPHNRPGDSSSTFRVPDIDSDDEMEVYDEVEVRRNIFSASQQPTAPAPAQQPTTPLPPTRPAAATFTQSATAPLQKSADSNNTEEASTPLPQPPQLPAQQVTTPPQFAFPSVAPRPSDYHVSDEFKEAAGVKFAAGFAVFVA